MSQERYIITYQADSNWNKPLAGWNYKKYYECKFYMGKHRENAYPNGHMGLIFQDKGVRYIIRVNRAVQRIAYDYNIFTYDSFWNHFVGLVEEMSLVSVEVNDIATLYVPTVEVISCIVADYNLEKDYKIDCNHIYDDEHIVDEKKFVDFLDAWIQEPIV